MYLEFEYFVEFVLIFCYRIVHKLLQYTTKHRTDLIIFPLILQTIVTAQMSNNKGDRIALHGVDGSDGSV